MGGEESKLQEVYGTSFDKRTILHHQIDKIQAPNSH